MEYLISKKQYQFLIEQISEPPQGKCGITKACEKGERQASKEMSSLDKEAARQEKIDQKYNQLQDKLSLNMDYDMFNEKRTKEDRDFVRSQFTKISTNPSFQGESSYKPEQKFSVLYKVLENLKRRPQISYTLRLKNKFNFSDPKTVTLEQLSGFANQMGWDKFIQWYQSGGPEIK